MKPILMTEECWANSPLSLVRHYGSITVEGTKYVIVNKDGKDLFECSNEAKKAGRDKAIEAGEPADLIDYRFISYYKKLGRERFIEVLEKNKYKSDSEIMSLMKEEVK